MTQNTGVVATFSKRAKEAAIASRVTPEAAEATTTTITVDDELTFVDTEWMQE